MFDSGNPLPPLAAAKTALQPAIVGRVARHRQAVRQWSGRAAFGRAQGGNIADMPASKMPSTLKRSPQKAQETYEKTLEHAEEEYPGDEERAHRTAYALLKHNFE